MIIEYHRPENLEEALALLNRQEPVTLPMGGGTVLNRPSHELFAVVDLQALSLTGIVRRGKFLDFGAGVTLQSLLEAETEIGSLLPVLSRVIELETTYNMRHAATLAGSLVSGGGRSPLAAAFLALDAQLTVNRDGRPVEEVALGDVYPVRKDRLAGALITRISIPANVKLAYQYVARTPADLPIVCAAVALWPSGRTRLVLGGFGKAPILAMDGPQSHGIEIAASAAYSQAADEWASAEYRREMAAVLAARGLKELAGR